MTTDELARATGYRSFSVVNAQYGALAHMIADAVGYDPAYSLNIGTNPDGPSPWTAILADCGWSGGTWRMTMHQELAEALGMVAAPNGRT